VGKSVSVPRYGPDHLRRQEWGKRERAEIRSRLLAAAGVGKLYMYWSAKIDLFLLTIWKNSSIITV
jgi:hypothetical protein